jgi:5-methylcytosine-specific restriction endonuclease McrA
MPRPARPANGKRPAPARKDHHVLPSASARSAAPELAWPASFDDWMIDIVRRRALRLNSGARRRGVRGTVRAVELAHVLERSKDEHGRWICAICKDSVTLHDLSFDHVVALADGGEHAAYNLVPAHRKCNEIKGSEKAQTRAEAVDRWFSEWSARRNGHNGHAVAQRAAAPAPQRRYA